MMDQWKLSSLNHAIIVPKPAGLLSGRGDLVGSKVLRGIWVDYFPAKFCPNAEIPPGGPKKSPYSLSKSRESDRFNARNSEKRSALSVHIQFQSVKFVTITWFRIRYLLTPEAMNKIDLWQSRSQRTCPSFQPLRLIARLPTRREGGPGFRFWINPTKKPGII